VAEQGFSPEQLAEQIRRLKVADILLSTVSTLGQLAYVKLEAKQLDEARLAIDGIAALLPALEGHTDAQTLRDFNQLLANVRLSYASATDSSRVQDAGDVPKGEDAAPQADADAGAPTGEGGAPTDTPSGPIE
jgi:hypothetical protein